MAYSVGGTGGTIWEQSDLGGPHSVGPLGSGSGGVAWVRPTVTQPAPVVTTPTIAPIVTGIDPSEIHNALYGKVIPLSALGLARIGTAGLIFGPYFNAGLASFAVSFGFPANPAGTRRVYEVSLDSKIAWELAAGSPAGTLDAAGFIGDSFTCRFYGGTQTQGADALEIAQFGDEAVAYRPQMMLWFENLSLEQFGGKVPFVSAKIGDVTDGAVPGDGINLGDALERFAWSPWLQYDSSTFEATGVADIIGAMILTEDQSFLDLLRVTTRVYRTLDLLQTDKLRINDRGSAISPDLVLTRDRIAADGGVQFNRQEEAAVSRELELLTIDPDADYVFMPSKAARPLAPVPVTSSVAKDTITLPVVIGATTRASLVHFAKYAEDHARKRVSLQTMLYGYALEPGDLFRLDQLVLERFTAGDDRWYWRSADAGFDPGEIFKVVETSHGANYINEIIAEPILKCAIDFEPDAEAQFQNVYEATANFGSHTFTAVDIGEAAADRMVVIFAGYAMTTGFVAAITLTALTVDGVAATIAPLQISNTGGGSDHTVGLAVAYKAVAAGTTADIEVTFSGGTPHCYIAIYSLSGLASAVPFDIESNAVDAGSPTVSIDVPTDGVLLAMYVGSDSPTAAVTWTGATEDFDQDLDHAGLFVRGSGAKDTGLAAQTGRTVTATSATSGNEILLAITFG